MRMRSHVVGIWEQWTKALTALMQKLHGRLASNVKNGLGEKA
jgi:hypothetical protein